MNVVHQQRKNNGFAVIQNILKYQALTFAFFGVDMPYTLFQYFGMKSRSKSEKLNENNARMAAAEKIFSAKNKFLRKKKWPKRENGNLPLHFFLIFIY